MKTLLGCLMISNAALFFFGAVQHLGIAIGRFHEPRIIPAAVVETICGISLAWGRAFDFQLDRPRRGLVGHGGAGGRRRTPHGKQ